jgi:hypothetical protein
MLLTFLCTLERCRRLFSGKYVDLEIRERGRRKGAREIGGRERGSVKEGERE